MTAFHNVAAAVDLSSARALGNDDSLSPASEAAFSAATLIAVAGDAHLHLIAALDLDPFAAAWLEREELAGRPSARAAATARLARLAATARVRGVAHVTAAVPTGAPADAVIADVRAAGRDLVVCGTRERGAATRALLGSTSLRLVRRAPCAVWVARGAADSAPSGSEANVVLCAVEIGSVAALVLDTAARIAAKTGAALHVVHIVDLRAEDVLRVGAADAEFIRSHRSERRARAEREIPALVAHHAPAAARHIHLVDGDANDAILATAASLRAGLVVMGSVTHGVTSASPFLGRTAEHVVVNASASVLILKP